MRVRLVRLTPLSRSIAKPPYAQSTAGARGWVCLLGGSCLHLIVGCDKLRALLLLRAAAVHKGCTVQCALQLCSTAAGLHCRGPSTVFVSCVQHCCPCTGEHSSALKRPACVHVGFRRCAWSVGAGVAVGVLCSSASPMRYGLCAAAFGN